MSNEGDLLQPVPLEPVAVLTRSWEILRDNPVVVLGAAFLPIIVSIGFQVTQQVMQMAMEQQTEPNLALVGAVMLVALVGMLVQIFFQLGMLRIFSRLARGLPAELSMLVGEVHHLPAAIGASVILAFAVAIGLLLLIVPGVILGIGLQFALIALIDQDLGPIQALEESWRLTDGYKLAVFVVNLLIGLIGLAVICGTLGVGYLLVVPIGSLTQAVIYHSLMHAKAGAQI
ncbi:MAG: hypothetical protein ABMA64_32715 [Myxococcota bacterium]